MTLRSLACVVLAVVWGVGGEAAHAQVPATIEVSDTLWQVQLANGSTLYGRIVEVDGASLIVSAAGVTVELGRDQIRSLSPVRGTIRDGAVWLEDANTTRLFFGPTGRMMRAGEGYVAAFELFLPFVSYSFTDWLTLAGGTPLIPEAIGEIFYLAPKVGVYQRPDLALSTGVLAFFSTYQDFDSAGILYGVGTWGEADRSVTLGAGWPFVSGDIAKRPVFMGGGEARMSRRTKLVTENYLITFDNGVNGEVGGLLSGGIRFIGERLSADLGLGFGFGSGEGICCIPLVNFVYHLGSTR